MIIGSMIITIYTPWVHSLKEKRAIVKSICAKTKNKFNVSIAEIDEQDTHQQIVIGLAAIANQASQVDRILDSVMNFIESSTEGNIIKVDREII